MLITAIAGVVCYGFFVNRGLGLPILGYDISPAERVMQGEVPYRDFLYNYTPGVLWLNALLMRAFGTSVMTINLGLLVFKVSSLVALFYVAQRLSTARTALIPVALTLAWVGYRVVLRPYPTQYSMLFVLLALIFILRFDKTEQARWLFLCGLAVGLVFLFKQNVGVLLLGSATTAVVFREIVLQESFPALSQKVIAAVKKASVCWFGFATIAAALFIYLAYAGALGAMSDHFVSLADEYREKRSVMLPSPRQLAPAIIALLTIFLGGLITLRKAPKFFEFFVAVALAIGIAFLLIPGRAYAIKTSATAAIFYLPPVLLIVVFAIVAWDFWKAGRTAEQRYALWRRSGPPFMVALFALGAYAEVYPRADYAHLVRILPPIFLLLFLAASQSVPLLTGYFQNHLPSARRAAFLCVAVPIVAVFAVGIKDTWQPRFNSRFQFADQTPINTSRARGVLVSQRQAAFIDELAAAIEAHSSRDDYIFSFAPRATAFYFLSARRNPSRLVWWRSAGIKSEDRDALLEQIAQGVPKLVLVPKGFNNERVLDQVGARYHQIDAVNDITIYDRNK